MLPSQIPLCAELQQRSRPLGAPITLILLERRVLVLPVTGPTPNCPSVGWPTPRGGRTMASFHGALDSGKSRRGERERASDAIETIKL